MKLNLTNNNNKKIKNFLNFRTIFFMVQSNACVTRITRVQNWLGLVNRGSGVFVGLEVSPRTSPLSLQLAFPDRSPPFSLSDYTDTTGFSLSLSGNGVESVQNPNQIGEFSINVQKSQPRQGPSRQPHRQMDAGTF